MTATILIVDHEPGQLRTAEHAISHRLCYHAIAVNSADGALDWVRSGRSPVPDLLLLDLKTPGSIEIIKAVHSCRSQLPVIALSLYGEDARTAEAVTAGACDFLTKPIALDRLRLSICNALKLTRMARYISYLEQRQAGRVEFSDIIGSSPMMVSAVTSAKAMAALPSPVWIRGEEGTGKELLARAMHAVARSGFPFVAVDCAAAPDAPDTLTAQLRAAEGGTFYLRHISALPLPLQQSLLESLAKPQTRVIFASSADAETLAAQGWLHRGWLSHVGNATVTLPSLRDRRQDIPLLARHFVYRFAASERKNMYGLSPDAVNYLMSAPWPGNVRQLASLLWRAVLICNQELLDAGNIRLIQQWQPAEYQPDGAGMSAPALTDVHGRIKKLRMIEEDAIRLALHHAGGSMTRAAKSLGIGRSTLYRRVHELNIDGYISRANQTTRPMIDASSTSRS